VALGKDNHGTICDKGNKKTFGRNRADSLAKGGPQGVTMISRVDVLWNRLDRMLNSPFFHESTLFSVLTASLVCVVESRQLIIDINRYSKVNKMNAKRVAKSAIMENVLETLYAMESHLNDVLYFVAHRMGSDSLTRNFSKLRVTSADGTQHRLEADMTLEAWEVSKKQVTLPPMVDAAMLYLKDACLGWNLDTGDSDNTRDYSKLDKSARSMHMQGYGDLIVLLSLAELASSGVGRNGTDDVDLLDDACATTVTICRANAFSILKNQYELDLINE